MEIKRHLYVNLHLADSLGIGFTASMASCCQREWWHWHYLLCVAII